MKTITLVAIMAFTALLSLNAQDITLPQPVKTGGMPLMEALSKRQSCRQFSTEEIDIQTISNLLWAAWGFNRDDKRTAPSARNTQEIELYIVMKSGAYLYDARQNVLRQVSSQDVRMETGTQAFVATAPINIVLVADQTKGSHSSEVNSGYISQNIYLFCASEGLATVARGMFDAQKISKALNLNETQKPVLAQTVGKIEVAGDL
jgi:SagB-type dehydrogenase family enzyme